MNSSRLERMRLKRRQKMTDKKLERRINNVDWSCRFHPTDGFHEIGCPHMDWTKEQLYDALLTKKEFEKEQLPNVKVRSLKQSTL